MDIKERILSVIASIQENNEHSFPASMQSCLQRLQKFYTHHG
jgi:hypothetical protein